VNDFFENDTAGECRGRRSPAAGPESGIDSQIITSQAAASHNGDRIRPGLCASPHLMRWAGIWYDCRQDASGIWCSVFDCDFTPLVCAGPWRRDWTKVKSAPVYHIQDGEPPTMALPPAFSVRNSTGLVCVGLASTPSVSVTATRQWPTGRSRTLIVKPLTRHYSFKLVQVDNWCPPLAGWDTAG
jgi:hypothetical protein